MRCVLILVIGLLLTACNLTTTEEVVIVTSEPATIAATSIPVTVEVTPNAAGCIPPAGWNQIYIVASGDTLGVIAAEADVSVTELAEANCLDNPDTIDIGQELYLPGGSSGGQTTNLPTAAPVELVQTYNNPVVGIALGLPADWTIQESDSYIAFFGPSGDIIELHYSSPGQVSSPQEQVAACQSVNACLGNREIIAQEAVSLPGGINGIRVSFSADRVDGDPGPSVAIFMVVGNRSMSLRTFDNQTIFNQVLNSLRAL
ncbi:MAG: LysM peptidoglycan-binding domain-containing protein [Anaerolineae bacterium]|nr:LysM peptidoglycan-binding domain-containing protein [Anaerolineae bacterium]